MVDKSLNANDKRDASGELKEVRELIGLLKDVGVQIPSSLTTSLNRLQIALDTEKDLGSAFEEASKAVANLENDLNSACLKLDEEQQDVCAANVKRVWQMRNIKFTLDPTNPNSLSAAFIKKTVQRYTPSAICRHWDYCRRQVGR